MVFSTKDKIGRMVNELGLQSALSTTVFIDHGYTIAAISILFMATQALLECSNTKQRLKVKIFTICSFIGLAIIAFYLVAIFMPFLSVLTNLGDEVV
jgi:hypothetical protein